MRYLSAAASLSDRELLNAATRVAADERQLMAELLAILAELDVRRLYLSHSCSSLFTFCTQVLHLSEHAAYHRIEAARVSRAFPIVLDMVASGELTLTSVALLGPHLTRDNHHVLLEAARHKSKRDVEYQIACLAPRAAERSVVRRLTTAEPTARTQPITSHRRPSRRRWTVFRLRPPRGAHSSWQRGLAPTSSRFHPSVTF